VKPPSPVTSPAPKMPARASSVAGPPSTNRAPSGRSRLRATPSHVSGGGPWQPAIDRPTRQPRLQMDDDGRALARGRGQEGPYRLLFDGDTWVPDHQGDAIRLQVRPQRCSGLRFLEAKERRSASITVTVEPRRAKACPSSTPIAPPPRIASEAGSSLGIAAWRLVQNSTVFQTRDGWDRCVCCRWR